MESPLYTAVVVIGPILLAAAILWAILRNRTTPAQDRQTEEATRRMHAEQNREDAENE